MRMCMYMGIYAHLSRSKYETTRQRISNVLSTSTCIIYVHVQYVHIHPSRILTSHTSTGYVYMYVYKR